MQEFGLKSILVSLVVCNIAIAFTPQMVNADQGAGSPAATSAGSTSSGSSASSSATAPASIDSPVAIPSTPTRDPALRRPVLSPQTIPSPDRIRKDPWLAYQLAKVVWLDKAAAADPRILAAICSHPGPAKLIAQHRHLAALADADHYLCRRLTRWKGATQAFIRNPQADHVISLDPEGIYMAIDRDPQVARVLTHSTMFAGMIINNPDLGRMMSAHIR